ncbi:MAG: DUF937 domain-containing protein [Planctomycetota bacterium]
MDNLVDRLKAEIDDGDIDQISQILGESPERTQQSLAVALPAILAGVLRQASTADGAATLQEKLMAASDAREQRSDFDPGAMSDAGGPQLQELFGGQLQALLQVISQATQLDLQKITSLLSMLLPVVTGFLRRQMREGGWDTRRLIEILQQQQAPLAETLPGEFMQKLGLALPSATVSDTTHAVREVAGEPEKSLFGKSLPILLLIVVVLAVAKFFQVRNAERPQPRPMVEEVLPSDFPAASPQSDDAAGEDN